MSLQDLARGCQKWSQVLSCAAAVHQGGRASGEFRCEKLLLLMTMAISI